MYGFGKNLDKKEGDGASSGKLNHIEGLNIVWVYRVVDFSTSLPSARRLYRVSILIEGSSP
jgi:hypothetical protein